MTDYKYKARIIRVIDGDTVEAIVDLGFGISRKDIFRLAGINAPEHDQSSTLFLAGALADKNVVIESHKAEKYGRWLSTLWIQIDSGWQSVNQMLIDGGFAVPYDGGKR